MGESARVLVVDDDPEVLELLRESLTGHGYEVATATDGAAARAALEGSTPDAVLLDIGLPGEDGLTLARQLRERLDIGIIMVTGAGETVDRIVGLEVGADDYVTKPFDPRELRARLKSVLRRYRRASPPAGSEQSQTRGRIPFGRCTLDLEGRRLFDADGAEVPLTAMEFALLKVLAERPNRPLSRDQILNLTQNRDWDPMDRSIDIRIARLRRKIEADPGKPEVLRTVRGYGYMFAPR